MLLSLLQLFFLLLLLSALLLLLSALLLCCCCHLSIKTVSSPLSCSISETFSSFRFLRALNSPAAPIPFPGLRGLYAAQGRQGGQRQAHHEGGSGKDQGDKVQKGEIVPTFDGTYLHCCKTAAKLISVFTTRRPDTFPLTQTH